VESYFSSPKIERIRGKVYRFRGKVYRSRYEARADVFDSTERFKNANRRHSTIG
jgi:putative transposase